MAHRIFRSLPCFGMAGAAVMLCAAAPAGPGAGPASVAGAWVRISGPTADPPPLLASVKKVADKVRDKCVPDGVPDMILGPTPWQLLVTPKESKILSESLVYFRSIHMNAKHDPDPDPNFNGDSVGRWQGADLVVDTIGLSDQTTIDGVIPHSEDLHVVERFHRLPKGADGRDRLEVSVTMTDPKTFSKSWTRKAVFARLPDGIGEAFCDRHLIVPPNPVAGP